ncbi:MAG: hypothetical protein RL226_755 [Bacteroidota bacterium]
MLKHIFKIVWKNKRQNGLLLFELFVSLLILSAVFAYLINNYEQVTTPLGFETSNRYLLLFADNSNQDSTAYYEKVELLEQAFADMPEIVNHSFGNTVYPFSGNNWSNGVEINNVLMNYLNASMDERFEETMGLKMHQGRWFNKPLQPSDQAEIVINKVFYDTYFAGMNCIDSTFEVFDNRKVVGIVENYKYNGEFVDEEPVVLSYVDPHDALYSQCVYIQVTPETTAEFELKLTEIVSRVTGISDFNVRNLDQSREESSRSSWLAIGSLSSLAIFLVINVAMGLFGVLWTSIKKRRYEISLRKAMGATSQNILQHFMIESLGLTTIAWLVGVAVML